MKTTPLLHVAFLLAPCSFLLAQGSLTPPGAPAPTMKTLEQIEPRIDLQNAPAAAVTTTDANYHFIINQPGSYYLSANLGGTKTNGIRINAEGVTLDLNGFEISRAGGVEGTGIEIPGTSHRASVRQGSIKGFGYGIRSLFLSGYARGCAFRDLAVSGCTTYGIFAGVGAILEACRVHDNSGTAGIYAEDSSTLTNCSAYKNSGTYGIFANDGSTLTNCSASNNSGTYGIFANTGSTLTNCSAYNNTSSAATSAGIATGSGCTVSHCSSYFNLSTAGTPTPTTGMGFDLGSGNTIQHCSATSNRGDGINIVNDTVVRENTCDSNGNSGDGAGIHATSSDNRI